VSRIGIVLIAVGLLVAMSLPAVAEPSVALATDKKKLAVGESMTLTINAVVPTLDVAAAENAEVRFAAPPGLTITGARGPALLDCVAMLTYDAGQVTSNIVQVRLIGSWKDYPPLPDGSIAVPLGTLEPGDGDVVTVTVER